MGQPLGNNTTHQGAGSQLGAIPASRVSRKAAAPPAVSIHKGTVELVHKSPYEKQGGLSAVEFPLYFGHYRRVSRLFPTLLAAMVAIIHSFSPF